MADKGISKGTRREIIEAVRIRYSQALKKEKTMILDEFTTLVGCHRKHAIRLLGNSKTTRIQSPKISRRLYDDAVKEALIVMWEASDRICGKRLKALLPSLIDALERHGHLDLDEVVRQLLLSISASTIDRLLAPIRSKATVRKKRRGKSKKASGQIPVRTFTDWEETTPGCLEIDFVAHCGGSMKGSIIHSLVATDVCTGWTEFVPLIAREQSLVIEGLEVIGKQMPIPIVGINSDNDSAFINDTLLSYCDKKKIYFSRSRAYQKNDQAWIEQKNGAVIRRFVGYDRFSGVVACQALAHLFQSVRLYVNFFQPSFKLRSKTRDGAKARKSYYKPATPYDRLLERQDVDECTKSALKEQRFRLDPLELLHHIRHGQAALSALVSPELSNEIRYKNLKQFLEQLPNLWVLGEVRPTHKQKPTKKRYWRTRKDPFEPFWPEILIWLQKDPDTTAKTLFERLQREHPGHFSDGQLRTLQRRIKEWRHVMAKKLVYACLKDNNNLPGTVLSPTSTDDLLTRCSSS